MRLAIDGQGYASAAEAFVSGNRLAAGACETLAGRLHGYAGMVGDDSTATDFAASYDEAATESLNALADVVAGFGSLGHLAHASLANHQAADARSVITRSTLDVSAPRTIANRSVGILVATPPSSLGGDSSSLPGWANVVLDFLEGVIWPDADTDRLRAAASTWRTAAASVGILTAHCESALLGFEGELSPEIPLAIATTQDLRGHVEELAAQFGAVAAACDEYANHVDATRDEMLDLLKELAVEIGVGAFVAGGLSLLSGGLAAGAAAGAASGRFAWASRELTRIVDALRLLAGGTATSLRPVTATVRDSRAYLSRLVAARRTAMTERGSAMLGRQFGRGWLVRHERRGHTLEFHVARSREWLHHRVLHHPTAKYASSFPDQAAAERVLADVLRKRSDEIRTWLAGGTHQHRIDEHLDRLTGISVNRAGEMSEVHGLRLLLVKDPAMPEGYWIKTAYPQP